MARVESVSVTTCRVPLRKVTAFATRTVSARDYGLVKVRSSDGISEWRRIAATASSYNVTVCPHWFHDLHVHLVAATPNAHYVEYFPDGEVLNFRRLIDTQLKHRNGMLLLPRTPGLGFGFDEKAVARYALKRGRAAWTVIR